MICAWTSVLLWRTVPNFPCLTFGGHSIPASREFEVGDRSDQDCVVSQPVGSLRCDFQVWENRRHSRGLAGNGRVFGDRSLHLFQPPKLPAVLIGRSTARFTVKTLF